MVKVKSAPLGRPFDAGVCHLTGHQVSFGRLDSLFLSFRHQVRPESAVISLLSKFVL